jgi:putative oxidoreductase
MMDRGLNPGLGLAILRVALGVTFIAHGLPKLTGGIEMTAGMFEGLGIPVPVLAAWLVGLLETVGGFLLIIGFLVTPAVLLLVGHMFLGIILVHASNGWYVIERGQGGVEFSVILIASLLMLVFGGSGTASLDAKRNQEVVIA